MFPFNFGFIPGTEAADGDPLDILILNEEPLVPGCLIKARAIGVIDAEQTAEMARKREMTGCWEWRVAKQTPTFMEKLEVDKKL